MFLHALRKKSKQRNTKRNLRRLRLPFEQLEDRHLLAGDLHNALLPTDVNADRRVSPNDALQVIDMLSSDRSLQLPDLDAGVSPESYYDTSDDGVVSPLDALLVINAIEADRNGYVLTDITSLGSHYLKATFDAPVMGAVLSPDAYVLTSADSNRVEVMSAALGENPNEVILAMAAPLGADIEVRFNPAVTAAISTVADLQGNSGDEIYLETSIALDNTSVLLTFNDSLDPETAGLKEFYRIVAANDEVPAHDVGNIAITAVQVEGRTVILETSSLENIEYRVKVTNALDDGQGTNRLIDPTRNTSTFFGIPSSDGLRLISGVSTSETTVLLSFSEPLAVGSDDPSNFLITYCSLESSCGVDQETLIITDAQLSPQRTQVTLTTLPQPANSLFTATVSDVVDRTGSPINANTAIFDTPPEIADRPGAPELVVAISTSETTILLTFSEPISTEGLNPTNFTVTYCPIGEACPTPNAVAVTDVDVNQQGTTVTLTTLPQPAGVTYTIEVHDLVDLGGTTISNVNNEVVYDVPLEDAEILGAPKLDGGGHIARWQRSHTRSDQRPR